jgi:hypothetical protein
VAESSAPIKFGGAEDHVLLFDRSKECWIRNVDFPHFFPAAC